MGYPQRLHGDCKKGPEKAMPRFTTGHGFDDIDNFLVNYFFFFFAAAFFFFLVAIVIIPPFFLYFVWPTMTTQALVYFLLQNCQHKTVFYFHFLGR